MTVRNLDILDPRLVRLDCDLARERAAAS